MSAIQLTLSLLPETLAVCRLSQEENIPGWATKGEFYSVTRTADELSIVCDAANIPPEVQREENWRCLKIAGTLDFSMIGILSSLTTSLAEAEISIFAISTFDTDYLLVKSDKLKKAIAVLSSTGHRVNI
ncbi:MAG: ACT domain-containing protein [Acidobacteriota bacterium]